MAKFEEADARLFRSKFVCKRCKSAIRATSMQVIQGKALQALRKLPLSSAMEAVRALDLSIRQERLIRGEPSDRTAVTVEDVVRREYERWMAPAGDEDND